MRDVWLRTGLSPRVLERLADADAFGSLGLTRRDALWAAKALGRVGDQRRDLPLFACNTEAAQARIVSRSRTSRCRRCRSARRSSTTIVSSVCRCARIRRNSCAPICPRHHPQRGAARHRSGTRVAVSGLITFRQRPGSAKGVMFMTIEDETAVANIIVWPKVFERFRPVVLGRAMWRSGRLQEESGVIHVVADQLEDLTPLLAGWPRAAPTSKASRAATKCAPGRGSARGARRRGRSNRSTG